MLLGATCVCHPVLGLDVHKLLHLALGIEPRDPNLDSHDCIANTD